MFEDLMSDYGSRLFIAVAGVGLGLVCLFVVLMMMRRRTGPSPFLRGGKNRQPRLQVLDAAAVDARRRIVLIRRDDVEHLVMIGGPTDVVIESGIGAARAKPLPLASEEAEVPVLAQPAAEPRLQAPARQPQLSAPTTPAMLPTEPSAPPSARERVPASPATVAQAPRREPRAAALPAMEPALTVPDRQPSAPADTPVVPPASQPAPRPSEPRVAEPRAGDARATEPAAAPKPEKEPTADLEPPAPARPLMPTTAPDIGAASDALDAARRRVFQPALDRTPPPLATQPTPVPAAAAVDLPPPAPIVTSPPDTPAARGLGSEFDRILEEEMANNLADVQPVSGVTPQPGALPRRDPASPRLTGATPEPSLQQEVARIFGEMSVTREDRA